MCLASSSMDIWIENNKDDMRIPREDCCSIVYNIHGIAEKVTKRCVNNWYKTKKTFW